MVLHSGDIHINVHEHNKHDPKQRYSTNDRCQLQ